jgi:hypothetical protein
MADNITTLSALLLHDPSVAASLAVIAGGELFCQSKVANLFWGLGLGGVFGRIVGFMVFGR